MSYSKPCRVWCVCGKSALREVDLHAPEPRSWKALREPFQQVIHYQRPEIVRSIFLERFESLR